MPTIFDSLNASLEPTILAEPHLWYCPLCKAFREATRKYDLWELPEILVVQFMRLEQSRWFRSITTTHIDFPMDGLDLTPYLLQNVTPCPYSLTAVMNLSSQPRSYSSYVLNKDDKKWHSYDATGCCEIDSDGLMAKVCTGESCVLFYQRKKRVRSLKDVCLLQIARRKAKVDLNVLPVELREALDSTSKTNVRYFL